MKKSLIIAVGALTLSATLSALAGPDWRAIEHARKAMWATQLAQAKPATVSTMADRKDCPPPPLVLLLDHGPRAQTTPYVNRQRKERYETRVLACKEGAK